MSTIEDLSRYLAESGDGDELQWEYVEAEWGITFPDDYKAFVNRFGAGSISDYLTIGAPFVPGDAGYEYGAVLSRPDSELLDELESPFPAFPKPGGIIDIGGTPNGDSWFFRTALMPTDWHIVTWSRGGRGPSDRWYEHSLGFSDFILALFRRELPRNPFGGSDLWGIDRIAYRSWKSA